MVKSDRLVAAGLVLVAAVLLSSCLGFTTGATNIVQQSHGLFSAQLNFVGSCGSGEHCSWYVRYRRVGTATWANEPATPRGPIAGPMSKVSLSENVTGLTARTQYEYQACGNAQPRQPFSCVGPDRTSHTTSKFTTPTLVRPTVTGIDNQMAAAQPDARNLVVPGYPVTITGTGFSTAHGATTFDFGAANLATSVTCTSTTQCTATTPPDPGNANPTVDVIATVDGVASSPNPPYDQAIYFRFSCGCGGF
jgi:hypothetical protein